MKARKDELLTAILFCAFLAGMSILFLLLPKQEQSQREKRYLATPPEVTWQQIASGEFGADVETYMADHLPGRDFFVGLNSYFEMYTGRQAAKDIYVTANGSLVEAPAQWDDRSVARKLDTIGAFSAMLEVPVDLLIVPSSGWARQEQITGIAKPYYDEDYISRIYSLLPETVRPLDLTEVFRGADHLYYRTDHHWTSQGAHLAYCAYMQALGRNYLPADRFTVETVEDFKGANLSRSALWLTEGEPLELWTGSAGITVTNGESDEVHEGVFYRNRLEELDKYTVYLDGNHSIVRLENPANAGKGKLLVIRDSYSNCLGTFLAESYETVVLVDLRYFKQIPVSQLCQEEGFDNVLICYSLGNFLTDENIIWLR